MLAADTGDVAMIVVLPLRVQLERKKDFILNLNNYRNAHYRVLSQAKTNYTAGILWHLQGKPKQHFKRAKLDYVYYHGSKGAIDVSNPCSIIDKFTCDALVKHGVFTDDTADIITGVSYSFGGIDKENPRCELTITELQSV